MHKITNWAIRSSIMGAVIAATVPSFGAAAPSLNIHSGTFAQFTFANSTNPFVVTESGTNFSSNVEQVTFQMFDGVSSTPAQTVHALMSFSGVAGIGADGASNVQNINYSFVLDPSYYTGLNASNSNLLNIGTHLQPDNQTVGSSVQLNKGRKNVSALSGETTAYSSDYFYFGTHNDTDLNDWSASFINSTFTGHGPLGFSTPSGSGQFDAEEFALTHPLPTPEAGSMASLGLLMVPAGFMFFRRRRAQATAA